MSKRAVLRDPPLSAAWRQALASIRVRFWRHALTGLGIALGTAFFASALALRAAERAEGALSPADESRLLWLAATSLLMCLVGVTNSMLLSVTERIREIGTIKCIGASDTFIVKVFFLEALLLGSLGSALGSAAGALVMGASVWLMGYSSPFAALGAVLLLSAATGLGLTVASAIAPAIQAARMPAVAALRTEV